MAAEVDPAHVSVVQWSLNMVQPMMSAFQATPATPIELLGVAPITPARKVPCPVVQQIGVSAVHCNGASEAVPSCSGVGQCQGPEA
jgi:hypothetical protein